jgi:hypothetical protein
MLTIIDKEHFMTTASTRPTLDKPDRIAVFGVSIVALCFAAVFLLLGAFDALRTLTAESVHLSVDADAPLGGALSAVLQQCGEWSAGRDALFVTAWGSTGISDPGTTLANLGWPDPAYFALQIPFLPLLLGLGLTAIAAVFRAGERLQRDTEGLV